MQYRSLNEACFGLAAKPGGASVSGGLEDIRAELQSVTEQLAAHAPKDTIRRVRAILRTRARRATFFKGDLFADPAWDMLLTLYAAELADERVSVTSVCHGSGVPATTALRWIAKLESEGLITKREDPLDGRRIWVALSAEGFKSMEAYWATLPTDPV
jgi:DNA-binding MarR family transcriptional regulator